MQNYLNLCGKSGVSFFEIGNDFIKVMFSNGKIYTYTYRSAGMDKVEEMKRFALRGCGLNSFIMRYAKYDYER